MSIVSAYLLTITSFGCKHRSNSALTKIYFFHHVTVIAVLVINKKLLTGLWLRVIKFIGSLGIWELLGCGKRVSGLKERYF